MRRATRRTVGPPPVTPPLLPQEEMPMAPGAGPALQGDVGFFACHQPCLDTAIHLSRCMLTAADSAVSKVHGGAPLPLKCPPQNIPLAFSVPIRSIPTRNT
eukprot:GGOE01009484.1.p3 GENE.GGOE01009484.1~~GGOE01009484.1.p3  ORF type:complete len:101 (+),score=3.49 GGOE01009484.1:76-378(+)